MKTLLLLILSLALLSASVFAKTVKGPTPAHASHGAEVSLADLAVPGKTTIFDFTSEYCPPCRAIAPYLVKLHQTRDDLAVVKIDINRLGIKQIDWKSPVALQYKIRSIPQFKVFGPDGKMIAEGDAARDMVHGWLGTLE